MVSQFDRERHRLVELLRRQGVRDERVLAAVNAVPRELFVPEELLEHAYRNAPVPIEEGQTVSQPYIVAYMAEALQLKPGDKVLEIGAGSGYAAAVMAELARDVFTIERHENLARTARTRLAEAGYRNIHVRCGDGTLGWEEQSPFDAISVAAGGPRVPEALLGQLAGGGRLVMPVGDDRSFQRLVRVTRIGPEEYREEDLGEVRFVPLIGAAGWEEWKEES